MEAQNLAFTGLNSIPKIVRDFLSGDLPGFGVIIFNVDNFRVKIKEKSAHFSKEDREILCKEISEQYKNLPLSAVQMQNLDALANKNTFTITTGHQLNLFSGPVFFIYKILQTIKTAAFLKEKFTENDFVPIFWMATEDHDFEEINHFKTENNLYQFEEKSGGPVGRIKISDLNFIDEFINEMKGSPFAEDLIKLVKDTYKTGETLTDATKMLVQELFADYGLLVLDGDSANLKRKMIPVFSEELQTSALKKITEKKVNFLSDKYGKVQVNPRDINLFYLSDVRERIENHGNDFKLNISDEKFSKEEILADLEENPVNFSPNALMRPVFQESVLPNICYIGGNAEIAYWLELSDYFKHLSLPFPILVPRNSLLFLPEKVLKKISNLKIPIENFLGNSPSEAINFKIKEEGVLFEFLKSKQSEVSQVFEKISVAAKDTDITFGGLVAAERARQMKSFARMEKRLLKAEKIKKNELTQYIQDIFYQINPGGKWQERVYNFSVFYKNGGAAWLRFCYDQINMENSELSVFPFLF